MDTPMTDDEVHDALAPGEPGDDLLLATLAALRIDHRVEVFEAGGVGPDTAIAVIAIGGRRMRLTFAPQ